MIAGVIIARALHVHADDSTACIPLARRKNMPAARVGGSVGPPPHADFGASGMFFGTLLGVLVGMTPWNGPRGREARTRDPKR